MRAVVRVGAPQEAAALTRAMDAPAGVYASHLAAQAEGRCTVLVAEVGGRVVGTGMLRREPRDTVVRERLGSMPEISNLQVHPDEQGRGHGTALVEAACALAAAGGGTRVGIGVGEDNPDAARLYLRLGFADVGLAYADHYNWTDVDGVEHHAADDVRYLVRDLGQGSGPPR
ncbi:GNAT family N-acetyltransferase [Klenkia brasiliensis]|uniref:Acetyltransferase (GNAT) family protein n=1 Tax=Klenkia brasiliensis TaxID=333142 RepID=A0A1G7UMG4_9ACTN|nr:GNAT family N-acetyltransferase [Klenkia brasiliensis]SDG48548.1 Acetyltransferase (GNAT) family protein [Klenkia brasiliensis]